MISSFYCFFFILRDLFRTCYPGYENSKKRERERKFTYLSCLYKPVIGLGEQILVGEVW